MAERPVSNLTGPTKRLLDVVMSLKTTDGHVDRTSGNAHSLRSITSYAQEIIDEAAEVLTGETCPACGHEAW